MYIYQHRRRASIRLALVVVRRLLANWSYMSLRTFFFFLSSASWRSPLPEFSPAPPSPNMLYLERSTAVREKKGGRGCVCEQLLDFKMGSQNRPLQFFITFLSLLQLRQVWATIHHTLYLNHFLPGSVLRLPPGASGTERVGRNKISAHITQD